MRLTATLAVALAFLVGCKEFPTPGSSQRNVVVIGDSLSTGHQNGCTVDSVQLHGYAKLVADQAGWPLPLPLISWPGIRPCMEVTETGNPGTIQRVDVGGDPNDPTFWGTRLDPSLQSNNLAIPGTVLADAFEAPPQLHGRDLLGLDYPAMWKVFLDTPDKTPDQTILGVARGLLMASESDRDIAIVWIGSNDALLPAIGGSDAVTDVAIFGYLYNALLGMLALTGTEMVVANIPDVSEVAQFVPVETVLNGGSARGQITTPWFPSCPDPGGWSAGDLVTLGGLWHWKAICDFALPETLAPEDLLTPAERTNISAGVAAYNAVIADAARTYGAVLVDVAAMVDAAKTNGYLVGADTLTTDYCGGLFSLDGVHPTNTGHAIVANAFIAAMDAKLGYAIPPVDVAAVWRQEPQKNLCVAGP